MPLGRSGLDRADRPLLFFAIAPGDQPCGGFQSADGMVLTIQGMPNLSTREPKPGDPKV